VPLTDPAVITRRTAIHLGLAQLISWGISYYLIGALGEFMSTDLGWSRELVYGGFSLALVVMGCVSPLTGRLIERCGGRRVMMGGSWLCAIACLGLAGARSPSKTGNQLSYLFAAAPGTAIGRSLCSDGPGRWRISGIWRRGAPAWPLVVTLLRARYSPINTRPRKSLEWPCSAAVFRLNNFGFKKRFENLWHLNLETAFNGESLNDTKNNAVRSAAGRPHVACVGLG
jgi:MFS family permease